MSLLDTVVIPPVEEEEAARLLLYAKCSCKLPLIVHCVTWFVYLLTDSREVQGDTISEASSSLGYVGHSNKPLEDLRSQNREAGAKPGDKSTRKSAGFLQFEIVLGVHNREQAKQMEQEWRISSRKLKNRIGMGWVIATKYSSNFFAYRSLSLIHSLIPESLQAPEMSL
jgi:hypothetical protein